MSRTRVFVADDHDIVRYGIVSALSATDKIDVIGESSTGVDTIRLVADLKPDVCLLDISMPDQNGLETCAVIRKSAPSTRVLILTMHQSPEYLNEALKAGAGGYLLKTASVSEIIAAIEGVHAGRAVFSDPIERIMTEQYVLNATSAMLKSNEEPVRLTRRELEITKLIVDGKTSQQIADELFISPRTVEAHRANLMQKLGLKNTAALVRYAVANGLG